MIRRVLAVLAILLAGCASADRVRFPTATPGDPLAITATEHRPGGPGPFPAVVLFHGCHGVLPTTREWAEWFRVRGYVALVVDSWRPRGFRENCTPTSPDPPNTARLDDAVGALAYLHSRAHVDRRRVGAIGWSNGGVYSMAVVNGPSLERARARGVVMPEPGYRASVAFYPGGCVSLVSELVVRPVLVLMGDRDDWTIPGPCVQMVENMRARGAEASIVLYRGAYHYFDDARRPNTVLPGVENRNRPGWCCGATVGYHPAAAADARRRVEEFFGYHLRS
jgi:dienelactone hydrolase